MDINWTYCGNHFTICVNQIIILYALNLYSDVYQLFLNKTGKIWKKKKKKNQSKMPAQALLFNTVLETVVGK